MDPFNSSILFLFSSWIPSYGNSDREHTMNHYTHSGIQFDGAVFIR